MAGEMPFRYACLLAAPISTLFDPQGHDADEVQAAHSSTVGQLDDSELLYLRSRGLSGAAPGWAPSRHTRRKQHVACRCSYVPGNPQALSAFALGQASLRH
ncbi:hypothetical protein GGR75_000644 [Xanthomonas campestris]|nr:SufD family Fe-S cluster assembly protein [Xanthomonas campestris]MEC5194210.1 hypothetical protein [Xanthomonas campestris]WDI92651.1 SufD family Fe-S cluster assembly protein [Xanthomonas campestris]